MSPMRVIGTMGGGVGNKMIFVIDYPIQPHRPSVISGQQSAVSGQRLAVSGYQSAVSD